MLEVNRCGLFVVAFRITIHTTIFKIELNFIKERFFNRPFLSGEILRELHHSQRDHINKENDI